MRIESREFAILHYSEPTLSIQVSAHPAIKTSDVSLTVGNTNFGSEYLNKVELPFVPQPALPEPPQPLYEFKLPQTSVATYSPGDSVPLALNYLGKPIDRATPTYVKLEVVNALSGERVERIHLAPSDEWQNVESPFGVVVRVTGGEGKNLTSIRVRSWSEEHIIDIGPPIPMSDNDGIKPPIEPVKPHRDLLCEVEIPLYASELEPNVSTSQVLIFGEGIEGVIYGVTIVIPAAPRGLIEFGFEQTEVFYDVKDCKVEITEIKGLYESKSRKGGDNRGKIYTNLRHPPEGNAEEKVNVQNVVLKVEVFVKKELDLEKNFVRFKVVDPDDPSEISEIDSNGEKGNDNYRDYPEREDKNFFVSVAGYEIVENSRVKVARQEAAEYREKVCCKMRSLGEKGEGAAKYYRYESKVELHVTDASGDNYKVSADLVERKQEGDKWVEEKVNCECDETGIMTVWRRVRVEIDVMKDKNGRNYLEKWLGAGWKEEIIKQLNESYNPKAFMEKSPPPNVCYVEFHDAGNTTELNYKEKIESEPKTGIEGKLPPLIRENSPAKSAFGGIDKESSPNYVYCLVLSKVKENTFGQSYPHKNGIVVFAERCEIELSKFADDVNNNRLDKRFYNNREIQLRLAPEEMETRIKLLLKKCFVHEMGHQFVHEGISVTDQYQGEAIIPKYYSLTILRLMPLKRYVGDDEAEFKDIREGDRLLMGDVMNNVYFPAGGLTPQGGFVDENRPAKDAVDPVFQFDYFDLEGDKQGSLANVYFCPKNIWKIRKASNPF
ncbi:MAG: hypothetical protein N2234_00455 [Planctomycetota bacterium]|nr:hypothetical protein [Planctomycetota bacterium]